MGEAEYEIFTHAQKAIETISLVVKCLIEIDPEEYRYLASIVKKAD